ncbi:hypothetical protein SZ55_4888 [Pseudomonas sp. FeS53a]|nr:hypothetical protein SZ55_4888 [Pseudomonas sp. FeS53a]
MRGAPAPALALTAAHSCPKGRYACPAFAPRSRMSRHESHFR